jgi:hypothetical protein
VGETTPITAAAAKPVTVRRAIVFICRSPLPIAVLLDVLFASCYRETFSHRFGGTAFTFL